jgi:hypothetical protein
MTGLLRHLPAGVEQGVTFSAENGDVIESLRPQSAVGAVMCMQVMRTIAHLASAVGIFQSNAAEFLPLVGVQVSTVILSMPSVDLYKGLRHPYAISKHKGANDR